MEPGKIFVHRNIANVVVHTDLNCLSVIQYAVEVLKVKHIIICGHYGCGGIKSAMENEKHGLIDNWLRHIKDVYRYHQEKIDALENYDEKYKLMCELNVIEQVAFDKSDNFNDIIEKYEIDDANIFLAANPDSLYLKRAEIEK